VNGDEREKLSPILGDSEKAVPVKVGRFAQRAFRASSEGRFFQKEIFRENHSKDKTWEPNAVSVMQLPNYDFRR